MTIHHSAAGSAAYRAENRALCESRNSGKLVPVREYAAAPSTEPSADGGVKPITRVVNGRTQYLAQIGQADVCGLNGRAYPIDLWEQQVSAYANLAAKGFLCGAVDHLGMLDGGNLRNTPIIHRELWMDGTKAMTWYEIVEAHSDGRNLKAVKDQGMAIGWSTFGYGSGRPATDADRAKYGIPADADLEFDPEEGPHYVIMQDWKMVKADAVDCPSFVNARDQREQAKDATRSKPFAKPLAARSPPTGLLSASEVKAAILGGDARLREAVSAGAPSGAVVEGAGARGSAPPAPSLVQYSTSRNGDVFEPEQDIRLAPTLDSHAYRVQLTPWGPRFVKMRPQTDELYRFAGSTSEKVLQEINDFWSPDTTARYEKLGLLQNRGILLYGPPGTGKTATLHQAVESVVAQGDPVFYVSSVYAAMEGLHAFREIEPNRKVVVALEDADNYMGYQERDFLQLLDGEQSVNGVLYLATTNYRERLSPRLLRPGRFDKQILVPPPPREGRLAYLKHKLADVEQPAQIDRLADETDGLSFGHLRELITAVYALKEPVADVLARLKGRVRSGGRESTGLPPEAKEAVDATDPFPAGRLAVGTTEGGNPDRRNKGPSETNHMQTLAELKAAHPELFAAHERAVDDARKPLVESIKVLTKAINGALAELKGIEGIELPQREVLPAETAQRIESLEERLKVAEGKLAAAESGKNTAQAELAAERAKVVSVERLAKVAVKSTECLKANAYAAIVAPKVEAAAKADSAFDETKVEAFVAAACEECDRIVQLAGGKPPVKQGEAAKAPPTGLDGRQYDEGDFADSENDAFPEAGEGELVIPEALAAYGKKTSN